MFPSVFVHSTNSKSQSQSNGKKPSYPSSKSADGQPFPFQIVEEKDFEVRYGERSTSDMGTSSSWKANKHENEDGDSGEWIMMQSNLRSNFSSV
jgi:hypothetical protein